MTHEEAFLRDIVEHADEDAPRLVYADWLDEQGRLERAEYIRLHVEWGRTPPWERRWFELAKADWTVPTDRAWPGELPAWPGVRWSPGYTFKRGFPNRLQAESEAALDACAAELFSAYPAQEVIFRRIEDPAALAGAWWLARLRAVELHLNDLSAEVFLRLGHSERAAGLRKLRFPFGTMSR